MKNNTDVNIGVHYFRHWSGTGNIQIRYIWKGNQIITEKADHDPT